MKKSFEEIVFWVAAIVAIVAIIFGSVYSTLQNKKQDFEEQTNNANNPSISYLVPADQASNRA